MNKIDSRYLEIFLLTFDSNPMSQDLKNYQVSLIWRNNQYILKEKFGGKKP